MFGKNRNLFILKHTRVLDAPTREQFEITVSLPDTASKAQLQEAFEKMIYVGDKRVELISKVELESQKKDTEVMYGETTKNADNRAKIKGSAKGN